MKRILVALACLTLLGCASFVRPPPTPTGDLECLGAPGARPTVVLEAGAFGGAADWSLVAESLVEKGYQACAYDRDGLGLADRHEVDRSPTAIAARLHDLLERHGMTAPVILAGHSNGGLYIEAFARMWPERTAGLVLVDAVGTDVRNHPLALGDLEHEARLAAFTPAARALGLTRLVPLMDDISPAAEAAARRRSAWTRRASIQAGLEEVRAFVPGLPAVDALPPLRPTIPVAVIVASRSPGAPLARDWRAAEVAPADRACRAVVIDAHASHTSILDAQRDHVVDAVDWLNGARPGAGVSRC
ncbi:MAG: alpha/beta hydrolase [Caulobacter sp.]|nr:alpha/beta hydrolase [Caulobacter sp.]